MGACLVVVTACSRQEEQTAEVPRLEAPVAAPKEKKEPRIVVPVEVQGKWKAVKVGVTDKELNREEIYTVEIGASFQVADSDLSLTVRNFLPAFIMDGTTMTSASNEPRNPAAQIAISEQGREVFRGWLFSLYPGTHAFRHPRYSFSLVDYVPAE